MRIIPQSALDNKYQPQEGDVVLYKACPDMTIFLSDETSCIRVYVINGKIFMDAANRLPAYLKRNLEGWEEAEQIFSYEPESSNLKILKDVFNLLCDVDLHNLKNDSSTWNEFKTYITLLNLK